MTENELTAGQMYLSSLFHIGELKRENDRMKDRIAELEAAAAYATPPRDNPPEPTRASSEPVAPGQTGTPRTVPRPRGE